MDGGAAEAATASPFGKTAAEPASPPATRRGYMEAGAAEAAEASPFVSPNPIRTALDPGLDQHLARVGETRFLAGVGDDDSGGGAAPAAAAPAKRRAAAAGSPWR
jgi:hypothetical protein